MSMTPNRATADQSSAGALLRIEPREAASELDTFLYIVSHDLRNSARALTEVPMWLRDDLTEQGVSFSKDVQENFDLLERHAKRLDRMLLDLLVYSRIGRMQETSEFSIEDVVEQVVAETSVPDHVTIVLEGDLPKIVMGYKDCFVLIKSILDNVVRHCTGPSARLVMRGTRRRDEVTLTFTDDGPGISQNDIQRAFHPMSTLRSRDHGAGSGMGLAIVQRIADQYRGAVWAGSGPNDTGLRLRVRVRDAVTTKDGSDCLDNSVVG